MIQVQVFSNPSDFSHFNLKLNVSLHRQKREQKAAHPRAMLNFKVAEFEKFITRK